MYLPQIEDGDVRMVSLNYVKADEQSEYQIGKSDEGAQTDPPPDDMKPADRKAIINYIKAQLREG